MADDDLAPKRRHEISSNGTVLAPSDYSGLERLIIQYQQNYYNYTNMFGNVPQYNGSVPLKPMMHWLITSCNLKQPAPERRKTL